MAVLWPGIRTILIGPGRNQCNICRVDRADDSTRDNGCAHYVPGSHHWNLLPVTGLANDMKAIEQVLTVEQKANFKPIAIELKQGEASFHHPLMVHGSFENPLLARDATVINVFRDGVLSGSDSGHCRG